MVAVARAQDTSMSCAGRHSLGIEQNSLPKETTSYKFQPEALADLSTAMKCQEYMKNETLT